MTCITWDPSAKRVPHTSESEGAQEDEAQMFTALNHTMHWIFSSLEDVASARCSPEFGFPVGHQILGRTLNPKSPTQTEHPLPSMTETGAG